MYHTKWEAWFDGSKLSGIKCKRLMDQHEVIINNLSEIYWIIWIKTL